MVYTDMMRPDAIYTMSNRSLSSNERKRVKRNRLFEQQNGHCYYCNCDCILPPLHEPGIKRLRPDNEATIEHLRSRLDPLRQTYEPGTKRQVMACYKCNHTRAAVEVNTLRAWELQERAKRHKNRKRPNMRFRSV